jgi:hypothetical protein
VSDEEINANSNVNKNTRVNSNVNNNGNINNANNAVNEAVPCDIEALQLQRPEIDVKIKDGPLVKFDRYTDLNQAVSTLQRVIAEKEATGAQIIDIRFQERVYIK